MQSLQEIRRLAGAVGRWLGLSKQEEAPAAEQPAGPSAVVPAPAPVLTPDQKKAVIAALLVRLEGAKAGAAEVVEDMESGQTDVTETYEGLKAYRDAAAAVLEQGRTMAEAPVDWSAVDAALTQTDDLLTRASNEWNFGQQVTETKTSIRQAHKLCQTLDAKLRAALKSAGL